MSLFRPKRETRAFGDSLADLLGFRGRSTVSGVSVDDDQALRLGSVFACVDLLAELVSTMPVDEFRRAGEGALVALPSSPLVTDPAGDGTGVEVWLRQVMGSLLLRGNTYGLIEALDSQGWPSQIGLLHPDQISLRRNKSLGPVEWFVDGKPIERWPSGPLWHLPAYTMPGSPVGLSPVQYAAETIGLGIATRKFGAQWFGDGGQPSGTIESDQQIDQAQATVLKERTIAALRDSRGPLVLGAGARYNPIQVSPEESQFLETTKANVADVARYFRVPPEMIGGEAGNSLTYANVEQRAIALLTYTVNPWLVRLERGLSRLRPRPRFVKFNADALLRVDLKTRYEAHALAIRSGWKSPDDVRRIEDESPIPDGNRYLWPPYSTSDGSQNVSPGRGGLQSDVSNGNGGRSLLQ